MAAMPEASTQPITKPVVVANIPEELASREQWLYWRWQKQPNGEWTKPPYNPRTHTKGDVTNRSTHGSLNDAVQALTAKKAAGIGFSFIAGNNLTFIDLDHCRDPETEAIDSWAIGVIRRFPVSFVEVSPSGTGLHIIVKATLPAKRRRKFPVTAEGAHPKAAIEMYSSDRYATITGHVIDDGHRAPGEAQIEALALLDELDPPKPKQDPKPTTPIIDLPIDIAERLEVARSAANGQDFIALYDRGDLSKYGGDQSRGDLALCAYLGFYLNHDPHMIDQAFRGSALMRDKWDKRHRHDGATYGQMTIERVIQDHGDTYTPRFDNVINLPNAYRNSSSKDSSDGTPVVPSDEIKDRFMTAAELCAMVPEDPAWVARPYVVAGGITELTGQIKSGKSTLLGYMVKRLVDGGDFLGVQTDPGPVVYLTEQTPTTFREILERSHLSESNDLHILPWHDVRADKWPIVVQEAIDKAKREGAKVLIVDTLPQFAGLRGDTENNAGDALAAIMPVQAAAQAGLAVIIVRHDRKSGGEVGASSRGSSAFGGAVDIILQLKKAEGNARPTLRVLSALSRFHETPQEVTVEWNEDGAFTVLGPDQAYEKNRIRSAILDIAPRNEAESLTGDDFWQQIPKSKRTTVFDALKAMVADGLLRRAGNGTKGDPHVFWVANEPDEVAAMSKMTAVHLPKMDSSGR